MNPSSFHPDEPGIVLQSSPARLHLTVCFGARIVEAERNAFAVLLPGDLVRIIRYRLHRPVVEKVGR
ncbi:MAG: hypothetical protein NW241_05850 [Bacteroidia bacterium]|nr:hypothetical protein [Bacteroidia bacterium]